MSDKEYIGSSDFTVNNSSNSEPFSVKSTSEVNIDRNALPKPVEKFVRQTEGVMPWETDPQTLYDYSQNLIVSAFIDTLAKDVANTKYTVENDKARELFKNPHPEKTFSDITEEIMGDLLKTGNAFIVINRYSDGTPAEITVPPANTMFKFVGDDGITRGYVQKIGNRDINQIDKDDVVHIEWSVDNSRYYGLGPTEMSLDQIDIIDELVLMEILDLTEGGISNIVSQTDSHDRDPMNSQEWDSLVTKINANKGERQENVVAKGNWDSTTVSTDYTNLELLDRYKFHIQTIAAAYKVNPSYVGFDFENTNRATDQSQQEAYRQRGIKTSLNKIREKFNQLIQQEFGEGEFKWDIETGKDLDEIEYYSELATSVQELQEAGVEFNIDEGHINIPEDAEVNTQEALSKTKQLELLNNLNINVDAEDILESTDEKNSGVETKPDPVDDCVESILEDNPEMDEETAYAICYAEQKDIEMTDKKEEFVDSFDHGNSFAEILVKLDCECESRREAIRICKENMSGFSPNTYYKWLELVGLKDE